LRAARSAASTWARSPRGTATSQRRGITEVVVLHFAAEQLQGYQAALPFTVVADPDRAHYRRFGVETGVRAMADTRAVGG